MLNQNVSDAAVKENAPKVMKETKNTIKVDFERTKWTTRFKLKYLSLNFVGTAAWFLFRLLLLIGISYVILQPFFAKISASFMSPDDFMDLTVKLIPKYPTLDSYKAIISENGYFTALLNTTLLSLVCAVTQTFICCLIGYGLSKFKFRGSKIVFFLVILTMVVPHDTLRLSLYMQFRYFDIFDIFKLLGGGVYQRFSIFPSLKQGLNLLNTYWPLFLLSLTGLAFKNGLYIFMMRQFFRGVPDELEESAYIDGSGVFRTFLTIIIPLSIPMMITIFLFAFSWQWTDNFYTVNFFSQTGPKLLKDIITTPKSIAAEYAEFAKSGEYFAAINSTAGLLIIAPLIVIYLFCQRYLVQGIERSGIVG